MALNFTVQAKIKKVAELTNVIIRFSILGQYADVMGEMRKKFNFVF
jgi:hypothetical protein